MMQMSSCMDKLASKMMAIMIMGIGIVLAVVTLFIATTSVVDANKKNHYYDESIRLQHQAML